MGAVMRRAIVLAISAALLMGALKVPAAAKKPGAAPKTFEASGYFTLPNVLAEGYFWVVAVSSSWGITGTEFALTCDIPETQELDGYVVELSDEISSVPATVSLDVVAETAFHDTYMVFFDQSCVTLGMGGWKSRDEELMPVGTKYVLVTARLGGGFGFDLKAVENR